jgi:hypothetical protein
VTASAGGIILAAAHSKEHISTSVAPALEAELNRMRLLHLLTEKSGRIVRYARNNAYYALKAHLIHVLASLGLHMILERFSRYFQKVLVPSMLDLGIVHSTCLGLRHRLHAETSQ